ncbi:hypothetical protein Y032_0421g1174 [Ancylostoma ceylanicum]|uniref:Major facilitator superfamily (MFS) profile domain-containing protein n=1 Tax=Ancylostoma ceylanicum TaxID=53326 RepID=A0A016X330_9BILA|nr:hypothetical protein Y032_0421g1174 [Ancylostoma ceylanicum]
MFIAITVTCFNWATNVDMLMAVVIPTRRSTANSWQILLSHMFGDATSPFIVGKLSDEIRGEDSSPSANFRSLVASYNLPNALLLVSAILYFCSAYTFVRDNNKFKEYMGVLGPAQQTPKLSAEEGVVPQAVEDNQAQEEGVKAEGT